MTDEFRDGSSREPPSSNRHATALGADEDRVRLRRILDRVTPLTAQDDEQALSGAGQGRHVLGFPHESLP